VPQLCLYLQLHQPFRLKSFEVFDVGVEKKSKGSRKEHDYFSHREPNGNGLIFQKVAEKSYRPMLALLEKLLAQEPNFTFALSASGIFLDQAKLYAPDLIPQLQRLAATGQVEFLAETYYHSLSSVYSPREFETQIKKHSRLIKKLFHQTPRVFRNTELIYSDEIGARVAELGFLGQLTEAVPRYLGSDDSAAKTRLHISADGRLPLLLKHAELSDDIAFRFSDRNWQWYPLTLERYSEWLNVYPEMAHINLFMDFETFGEHQWADTGIFEFFAALVKKTSNQSWTQWVTPSQVVTQLSAAQKRTLPKYHVPTPISWADVDRDLTAWIENPFQQDCLRKLYLLHDAILASHDRRLIEDWRRLQTSDHFYYMCTKWSADGDVHAYFSPYDSPYEAYRRFSIVLADLHGRVKNLLH
jgi:alpha-amylase